MSVGKRKRGRPKRWSDCKREDLESIRAVATDAADRSKRRSSDSTGDLAAVEEQDSRLN